MLPKLLIHRGAGSALLGFALWGLTSSASSAPLGPAAQEAASGLVAVRAGTIHCVQNDQTFEGGATILVQNGKILAVGGDLEIPAHAEVIDYGPDAVIVPGLVAPYSGYGKGRTARRSASPGTRALDNFNPFSEYAMGLSAGVTSAYITPGESRLISGVGALVKLGGGDPGARVLNEQAAIHCSVDVLSRNTPGYWDPPLPVNAEKKLGYAKPQLPATTMGAIVALSELVGAARDASQAPAVAEEFGAYAISDLAPLMDAGIPWRISAVSQNEIRAALRFARENQLPLVLEKVHEGKELAEEIAEAAVPVVFRVPFAPNSQSRNKGGSPDSRWPEFDVPASLVKAGVRVAIASEDPRDLLFSAALVTRGGLSAQDALRAITLTPAQISGSANRVGSIQPGKDADLCVLNAAPFSGYASVLATWVDGELAWEPASASSKATVLEVEELHVGDGEVLRPGQLLILDGRIAEVASRVSHPVGAKVVRAKSAMPGMIDAFGHLGLEGSRGTPATDFDMRQIIEPGDAVDRRVASHGITTVVMTPRTASRDGAPAIAYKPAATDFESQVVDPLAAVRLSWGEANAQAPGAEVKSVLGRAKEYAKKWAEYRKAMAEWVPPVEAADEKPKDEDKAEDEEKSEDKEESKSSKKSKKKKKEAEVIEPDPITGHWVANPKSEEDDEEEDKGKRKRKGKDDDKDKEEAEEQPEEAPELFKMRLLFENAGGSGEVTGNVRCPEVSMDLVQVVGHWDREAKSLSLSGLGAGGWVTLKAEYKDKALHGTLEGAGKTIEFSAKRTSKEGVVADRAERRRQETEKVKPPKGMPKKPKLEPKLEPYLRAMRGELAVVIEVNREDAILDCVQTLEAFGIKPVLYGASGAHHVADELAGRVAGVLLGPQVRQYEAKSGTSFRTPYSDLQSRGIAVAFHSGSEEGAVDLPIIATYAVANGMSPEGAMRALTSDAAAMMAIGDRVGLLQEGLDADILLLDGAPLAPGTSVLRTWVDGKEIR